MNFSNLLGIDGLIIKDFKDDKDENNKNFFIFDVELANKRRPACPKCHSLNVYSDGPRIRTIQDLPIHGKKVIFNVTIKKYNCQDCNCNYSDDISFFADDKANISNRLREALARESATGTFATTANKYDVSSTTCKMAFNIWGKLQDEKKEKVIKAPEVLGIDEAHLENVMRGVFIDSHNGIFLDIVENRKSETITNFIKSLDGYKNIKAVTMDMYVPYRKVIYDVLGKNITIIVDRFHVIQDLNKKAIQARKLIVINAGRPNLGNNANLMKMNVEDLNDKQKEELFDSFAIVPELGLLYAIKESFRTIYNCKTKQEALDCYDRWLGLIPEKIKDVNASPKDRKKDRFDPIRKFQTTVEKWKREIFNYFDYPETNAATEATNGLIKIMNRQGRGYSYNVLKHKALYGLSASSLPKQEVFTKQCNEDLPFNRYTNINIFSDRFNRVDITNNNLTPKINDILNAIKNGKLNFDFNKEDNKNE